MAVELSDIEIESLKHSSWEIECLQMTLKLRSQNNQRTFSGGGFIKQTANHQLTFKLYAECQSASDVDPWHDALEDSLKIEIGATIPDGSYYDLTALDSRGRVWVSERLDPDIHYGLSRRAVIHGFLSEISSQRELPREVNFLGSLLEFWIFNDIDIPSNATTIKSESTADGAQRSSSRTRNAWKFDCCELKFLFIKEIKLLTISAACNDENISAHLGRRILESLQFVLGHPINWAISHERIGYTAKTTIRSMRLAQSQPRFQPPLRLNPGMREAEAYQQLFTKYLQHTIDSDKFFHPLWGQLNSVYESGSGLFIDADALALTVAIESILLLEYEKIGKPTPVEQEAILEAKEYLATWNGHESIKKRIQGSIDSLRQARAGDRMKALVQAGAITEEQLKAWKSLRNVSAHEYQVHGRSHDKSIELLFKVHVLLYHLIFYAIGYRGPYTDFSSGGWQIKQYPPCE